jgi:hypothetical protein
VCEKKSVLWSRLFTINPPRQLPTSRPEKRERVERYRKREKETERVTERQRQTDGETETDKH